MKKEQIEKLIEAIKSDPNLSQIFGDRVAYSWFFVDLDEIWLVITPLYETKDSCYSIEMVQIQIIDGKDNHTRLQIKWFMDEIENFLNSKLKNFAWFETLAVWDVGDEAMLENNKKRYVFTKRFNFMYSK